MTRSSKVGTKTKYKEAMKAAGFPAKADPAKVNWVMTELILVILVIYVTMVYGPIAAFLVELVPGQDPLHIDVPALPHRQRLVRRHAAVAGHGDGRGLRRYLLRLVVSDRA